MRVLIHFGLAVLLVLAPALCCCNARWLTAPAAGCPSCPDHAPAAPAKLVKKHACCHAAEPESPARNHTSPNPPAPNPPFECKCFGERPDAVLPESNPAVAPSEPTGESLPVVLPCPAALPPEHLGLLGGLAPPERAGVDARSEALFSRHVMRC